MAYRLGIDSSTDQLSLTLIQQEEGRLIASLKLNGKKRHGQTLLAAIQQLLQLASVETGEISSLVVGAGPGSYTGLRIGMTAAKVWASSLRVPLYVTSSLALLASACEDALIIPIMDARRDTAYTALYGYMDGHYQVIKEDTHQDFNDFLEEIKEHITEKVTLVGQDIDEFVAVFKEVFPNVDVRVLSDARAYPDMDRILQPAYQALLAPVEDVAVLSPNYAHATLAEQEWAERQPQKGMEDEEFIEHIF